jgi:hypothetical protein
MNLTKQQQVELMATIVAGLKAGGSQRQPAELATDALQILEAIAQKVGV